MLLQNDNPDLSTPERFLIRMALCLAAQDILEEVHGERLPILLRQPDRLLGKSAFSRLENLLATSSPNQQFIILAGDENAYSRFDTKVRLRAL